MRKPSNYEECLRAIGCELDGSRFKGFALEEDSEAMWLLLVRGAGSKRQSRSHYRGPELRDLLIASKRRRRSSGNGQCRTLNYENMLRLVGSELDARSCRSFLLFEARGEIMVRYAMCESTQRPHLLAFSVSDLEALLKASLAQGR
jgi:hypothetical protein